jgi:hypothetical protein
MPNTEDRFAAYEGAAVQPGVEAVLAAAAAPSKLFARFNDWTGDHVPGFPVEVCTPGDGGDGPEGLAVIARFPADKDMTEALHETVAAERRRLVVAALASAGFINGTEADPYTPDQRRVSDYLQELLGGNVGSGTDPIGFLIASHRMIVGERVANAAAVALVGTIARMSLAGDDGNTPALMTPDEGALEWLIVRARDIVYGPAEPGEACIACAVPFVGSDMVLPDASGGFVHVACCGPERESYVGGDGEPLAEGAPLPTGFRWDSLPAPKAAEASGGGEG